METMDRQLRYFICIAELGSLSRAADALDQTQSGLSRQLARWRPASANRCSCAPGAAWS